MVVLAREKGGAVMGVNSQPGAGLHGSPKYSRRGASGWGGLRSVWLQVLQGSVDDPGRLRGRAGSGGTLSAVGVCRAGR